MENQNQPQQSQQPGQPQGEQQVPKNDIEENRVLAAVSYLWIVSVIVLIVKKDSKFAVWHAKQGLIMFIASIILSFIPFVGWILNLVILVFVIVGLVKALDRQWYKVPLIGDLAEKIKI